MIKVSLSKSKKGARLKLKNANGNIFNHFYSRSASAKRAWREFVKQIKSGKVQVEF